jgi:hypothetical protein
MDNICIYKTKKNIQCKKQKKLGYNYCFLHYKNNYIILPNDVILEILNYCDYNTINNYILTHKNIVILPRTFWYNIFNKYNLPIINIPLNTYQWNIEYQKISYYKHEIECILKYCNKFKITNFYIQIYENNNCNSTEYIEIYYNKFTNVYEVDTYIHPRPKYTYSSYTLDNFINMLILCLYKNPWTTIKTSTHIHLRKWDLILLQNKHGYKTKSKNILKFYKKYKL